MKQDVPGKRHIVAEDRRARYILDTDGAIIVIVETRRKIIGPKEYAKALPGHDYGMEYVGRFSQWPNTE